MMTIQQAFDLAFLRHQAGRLAEAEALYRQILAVQPNHSDSLHMLGVVASQAGDPARALELIRQSTALDPNNAYAHANLAEACRAVDQLHEAVSACRRALELDPNLPQAHNNLGVALTQQGHLDEAVAALRRAIRLNAEYADAHYNLGNALKEQGQFEEALTAYQRALQLKPDFLEAYNNLGVVLCAQGRLSEAIAAYRRALEINPHDSEVHSNIIVTLHFLAGHDWKIIAREQECWNQAFAEPAKRFIHPHGNERHPGRRLRLGYVSPDFRKHPVGWNLVPLFKHHDRQNFEILCYSGVAQPDEVTDEFRARADHWRSTKGVSDDALAEMIRQDGVDVLVDLSQHTAGNRLPLFARRPAPVQVSFAGYPESTGLEAMAYRISDRWLESEIGDRSWEIGWKWEPALRTPHFDRHAERVFLLESFWCYDPCGVKAEINGLPAGENGWITFGCLNNFCKISEPMLKLWARVLAQVKGARLVLHSGFGSHRQRTWDFLEREGLPSDRVEFVEWRPRSEYLALYHRLDLILDTFPYNGHTTSLDALWMGVPVVSLAGERAVSRAGLSQLSNLGLPELVSFTEEGFVEIATQLAHDLPRLAELRRTLRARMEASVLMDAPRFAHNIEAAYRTMWQRWCAEKSDA